MILHHRRPHSRALLLLLGVLLGTATTVVQAIYPDGHFDHVTKITDADQLSSVIDESLEAGATLFVRWIASAG